jgi:hypothetical protein
VALSVTLPLCISIGIPLVPRNDLQHLLEGREQDRIILQRYRSNMKTHLDLDFSTLVEIDL